MLDRIHWLHLSDADVTKARRVIDAFKEDDTIDALGFLRISERFDKWCYPGVTTPMTRARYYLFIPAIYAQLERQHLGYRAFRDRSEELQHELRRLLLRTEGPRKGVIGEKAGKELRRLPSNVYWSALSDLGILEPAETDRSYSELEYQRAAGSNPITDTGVHADDDDDEEPAAASAWDRALPRNDILSRSGRFRPALNLRLTVPEAGYLKKKVEEMPDGRESLFGFRIGHRLAGQFVYPWDVPVARMPSTLKTRLQHARSFSAIARALSLVYYAMLMDEKVRRRLPVTEYEDTRAKLEGEFRYWWTSGRRYILQWDLEAFQALVGGDRFKNSDHRFVGGVLALIREGRDARAMFWSKRLRELITERERTKRRNKCRLCSLPGHRRYLRQWKGPPNRWNEPFQLYYRHLAGDTIVRDLLRQPYRRRRDVQD